MKRNYERILLFCLFFLNLLFRFSFISKGPYHSDCLNLALQAEKILSTHQMHYLQGSGLPLTALMGAGFVWLGKILNINDPVFAVNCMSVFFGSLCIIALYFFTKILFNQKTAVLSALFLSLDPLFLALSAFGNSHPHTIFFLLFSLYFLIRYKKTSSRSILILSGICLGFMGASRLQDFFIMIIPVTFLFFVQTDLSDKKHGKINLSAFHLLSFFYIMWS